MNEKEKDLWIAYDKCAEDMARKGLKGEVGDLLPNLLSKDVVDEINADPESFQKRVNDYAYGIAMEKCILQYGEFED